jgi:hypothetical protein
VNENVEKTKQQSVRAQMLERRNPVEYHVHEVTKELSFVLEILIGFGQFLGELLVGSRFLKTVLPPYLCVVVDSSGSTTVPAFVFHLGKRNHLLVQTLCGLAAK